MRGSSGDKEMTDEEAAVCGELASLPGSRGSGTAWGIGTDGSAA